MLFDVEVVMTQLDQRGFIWSTMACVTKVYMMVRVSVVELDETVGSAFYHQSSVWKWVLGMPR